MIVESIVRGTLSAPVAGQIRPLWTDVKRGRPVVDPMSRERSEVLIDVLAASRPEIRRLSPRFVRGTFHDVVVLDGAWAARFPRTGAVLAEAPRRAGATRAIARLDLPFAVPHLVEEQLDRPLGEAHVIVTHVPGGPHPRTCRGRLRSGRSTTS